MPTKDVTITHVMDENSFWIRIVWAVAASIIGMVSVCELEGYAVDMAHLSVIQAEASKAMFESMNRPAKP